MQNPIRLRQNFFGKIEICFLVFIIDHLRCLLFCLFCSFRAGATASSAASASSTTASKGSKPTVIIMDEVDGMGGNEDRGGMAELVQIIKHTRTPIICIANDASSPKMRTLKNYCLSLTWRRVAAATLAPRLCEIARKEGLQIDQPSMEKIAESTQGDIRQMLNMLQMLRKASTHVTFDQVKARLDSGQKDLTLGAFDVVPMLFRPVQVTLPGHRPSEWIDDRINYYFVDSDIVPLFIFENYLHYKPTSTVMSVRDLPSNKSLQRVDQQRQNDVLAMEAASQAADSISCGDVISDAMFSEQDYSLQPIHAMLSTVTPSYIMRGVYEAGGRMGFPALLGKQSTRNKFLRIAREFKTELQADVRADADDITMWILPLMREEMIQALENNSAETDVRITPNKIHTPSNICFLLKLFGGYFFLLAYVLTFHPFHALSLFLVVRLFFFIFLNPPFRMALLML